MNGTPKLPPGWASDTDVAAVIAEIEKRVHRLKELDIGSAPTNASRERQFIHAHLTQLIKTGHS